VNALPPYAQTLGLIIEGDGCIRMPFQPSLIGAPERLHGGAVAGLLELAALLALGNAAGAGVTLKPVTITIDFLRAGAMHDTFAVAEIARQGRRIANIRATAWQESREKPIATAHLNVMLGR
jgi:uncharacterized protein (TIGR00369 family)